MLSHEVAGIQHNIYKSLSQKHLQQSFEELKKVIRELQDWPANEQLGELETSYRYMIQYMLDGVRDPERMQVYNHLLASTYRLADTVCEKLLTRDSMTLYYGKKRVIASQNKSLLQAFGVLDNAISELSLSSLFPNPEEEQRKRKVVEYEASNFFDRVWTNFPAEAEDYAVMRDALQPQRLPEPIAALIVSALTLNLLHCFDDEKLDILIDAYSNHDSVEVQMRAACGVFMTMQRYHGRLPLYERLRSRISLMLGNKRFVADMRNVLFQIIRSRDTEKIARKLTEEVLPSMMKISPALYKKIKEEDALGDLESLERNPEWQEMIDNSGIADKLMELNDLQMEGADVFMSTFSHLKGFAFFNDISNWFLPFMTQHTALADVFGEEEWSLRFARLLQSSGFLCNSDKYSFCLSLSQVPVQQRQVMASQFKDESMGMKEAEQADLYRQSRERENVSNRYIQDLYRFNKLFPRRNEFADLFMTDMSHLLQMDIMSPVVKDEKMLRFLGEYFFKHEYYTDAACIFVILTQDNLTDNELYQKTGFCFQSTGNFEIALEYYLKADLIHPNNLWTLRHIAVCYRNMKKIEMALDYFLRAEKIVPDNLSVNLNIGHCYLEQKSYDEALRYYFKVDYLDSKGTKARRPIAWCSFLAGKKEQAWKYYGKILEDNPNALDYLNAGHVAFSMGNIRDALSLYCRSIEKENGNVARFAKSFEQDVPDLIQAGIQPDDIPILYDQIIYQAKDGE